MTDRIIALIDMDCFYCQVEARENPELQGKPVCVVQYKDYKGGGIIAVNYEARKFGVTRQMRGDDAKQKCPDIICARVPESRGKADLTRYRNAGREVIQVLLQFGCVVERASIDEAYIDLTAIVLDKMSHMKVTKEKLPNSFIVGYEDNTEVWLQNTFNSNDLKTDDVKLAIGAAIVEEMRAEVYNQTGFRCSAGIGHNKVLAKLICSLHKPNKQTVLPHSQVKSYFATVNLNKVRGLGGKLGDAISEALECQTMGELAQISILDLRRHFDEKTTTWLFNLARGVEHEEVKERDLPKSIGCSKNFRGKELLDTRAKMEFWIGNLCEEVAERLVKDQEEHVRVAKTLTVSMSSDKEGTITRSGPLFSYDPIKMKAQALQLHFKTNELPGTDPNWRPKVCNVLISASKFADSSKENTQSIHTFFKTTEKEVVTENDAIIPSTSKTIEEAVIASGSKKPIVETVACEKCGKEVSPFELPEHLDYHLALELQAQLKQQERQERQHLATKSIIHSPQSSGQGSGSSSNVSGNNKRKGHHHQPSPSSLQDAKKQKTISSFFTKK